MFSMCALFKNRVKENVSQIYTENQENMEKSSKDSILRNVSQDDQKDFEEILELHLGELIKRLQSDSLKATTVLAAYQSKALEVHKKTNSIVCWVEGAHERAEMLDSIKVKERGPLHGIPVSVKEVYDIVDTYSTGGLAKFARENVYKDSGAVDMIKKFGGVPFCKTNVPQAMLSHQCSNSIYGTTTNPHGENRECGGSSGGEGALIGGGGSVLGVGNDIGGSLRSPAAFCGCYSLKPTPRRDLSQCGIRNAAGAHPICIQALGGFLARTASDLEEVWRIVWGSDRIRWDQKSYEKKPKIGYYVTDGVLEPSSGSKRAVTEAVDKLKSAGFETVEMDPPDMHQIMHYFRGIILAEIDSDALKENLSEDVVDSSLTSLLDAVQFYRLPWIIRSFLQYINKPVFPSKEGAFNNVVKLCKKASDVEVFTAEYLEKMDYLGVDIILCPAQLTPAPPTGVLGGFGAAVSPYVAWNVMKFPAGIAPITKWSAEDEAAMVDYPTDKTEHWRIKAFSKGAIGLPLAVQVS